MAAAELSAAKPWRKTQSQSGGEKISTVTVSTSELAGLVARIEPTPLIFTYCVEQQELQDWGNRI
jgi:hypothetical protein